MSESRNIDDCFCGKLDCDHSPKFCECQFCQAEVHAWSAAYDALAAKLAEAVGLIRALRGVEPSEGAPNPALDAMYVRADAFLKENAK